MKEYKVEKLLAFTRSKAVKKIEETANRLAKDGWELKILLESGFLIFEREI